MRSDLSKLLSCSINSLNPAPDSLCAKTSAWALVGVAVGITASVGVAVGVSVGATVTVGVTVGISVGVMFFLPIFDCAAWDVVSPPKRWRAMQET